MRRGWDFASVARDIWGYHVEAHSAKKPKYTCWPFRMFLATASPLSLSIRALPTYRICYVHLVVLRYGSVIFFGGESHRYIEKEVDSGG